MQTNIHHPFFIILVLTGLILIMAGIIQRRFPPKHPNFLYGYRTHRSRHSQQAWDFSQIYAGKQLLGSGLLLLLTGICSLFFPPLHEGAGILLAILLTVIMTLLPIIRTENALKKKFGR